MFSLTVIAATGDRFDDFAPFVASVNDGGTVANPVSVNAAGEVAVRVRLVDGRQVILRADPVR
jgi:hypothetical protein